MSTHKHVEECMGTVFSFHVVDSDHAQEAVATAVAWLHWVDETFSTYRTDSAISRIARGEVELSQCPAQVELVLSRCAELEAETDGYFSAYASGGLDPSGYVKGWAIERASDLLVSGGAANHMINGGGDVQCRGHRGGGAPWRIGISDPHDPSRLLGTVEGHELAVATSGTAERGRHITDPHTGAAPDGPASVTVVGRRLADVDAYATAAFAMGPGARAWLARRGLQHLVVDAATAAAPR